MDQRNKDAFAATLRAMGIDPTKPIRMGGFGKGEGILPPIPSSDPDSIEKNRYNNFYKYGAKEFWGEAEVISEEVKDFPKCDHYLMKRNHEVQCVRCNIGWTVPPEINVRDGKLYRNDQLLAFAA